jgi:hypothetical protein
MRNATRTAAVAASATLALLATGQPAGAAQPLSRGLTQVSHGDPYAACTIGGTPTSVLYPGAEVEPNLAVDPAHPAHIVGMWQQDRWNDGGAHGIGVTFSTDGGRSFTEGTLPASRCAPGGVNYERASDPWVSIGPDGTVYASALSFDGTTPRNTVTAAVSYDGGRSWRHPTELIKDTTLQFFNDKNSVTADPRRPGTAYQVWDRVDGGPAGNQFVTGPAMLSVTHDFGRTWSTPRVIVPTGLREQTIGNVIVADPRTGTLYDVYERTVLVNGVFSGSFAMVRSTDGGRTWSAPVTIAQDTSVQDVDPNTGAPLRTGGGLPSAAIDPVTGQLYMAYEGTDLTGGGYDQIQLTTSTDGGRHWSAPARVNGAPSSPAYTPSIAVSRSGQVAVTYYDIRTLRPGNTTTLPTSTWLTVSPRGGTHFDRERRIAPVFDFLAAPDAGGAFLGDYEGLVATGDGFRALFVTTNSGQPANRTDVFTGQFDTAVDPDWSQVQPAPAAAGPAITNQTPRHAPLTRH